LETSIRVHGVEWVAYFDETSGGYPTDRLDAVAGYLFDADGACHFLRRYRELVEPLIPVDKRGRKIFHASHCHNGFKAYSGTPRPIREAIMGRMATVIGESVTVGVLVSVKHQQYHLGTKGRYVKVQTQAQPDAKDVKPWIDSMYSMCLHRCIDSINGWLNAHKPDVAAVKYVVEAGSPHQEEASLVLSRIEVNNKLRARYRWGYHEFIEKGPDSPWLFAPDFYAWDWQRFDRLKAEGSAEADGTLLQAALDAKPHLAVELTEASVNTHAIINVSYGLVRPPRRG
jgi:hypothetical protein